MICQLNDISTRNNYEILMLLGNKIYHSLIKINPNCIGGGGGQLSHLSKVFYFYNFASTGILFY